MTVDDDVAVVVMCCCDVLCEGWQREWAESR
jgi:hypothetical protein